MTHSPDTGLDPVTAHRLDRVAPPDGPLVVCDVDEVVLHFLEPFRRLLAERDQLLHPESFRLHGNIRHRDGTPVPDGEVSAAIETMFEEQEARQTLVPGAREGLARLAERASVVLLTAMRHGHFDAREAHLTALGFPYPLVTTEGSKGRAIAHVANGRPVAFIDDLPYNHVDVRRHAPDTLCVHLMADAPFAPLLPPLPDGVAAVADWAGAVEAIEGWMAGERAVAGATAGA